MQLSIYGPGNNKGPQALSRIESLLYDGVQLWICVPERNQDVGIDNGRHTPRSSRSHFTMAFLPEPICGLPMPR